MRKTMQETGAMLEKLLKESENIPIRDDEVPSQGRPVNKTGRPSLWPGRKVKKYTYKCSTELFEKLKAKQKELALAGVDLSLSQIQAILVENKLNSSIDFFKRQILKNTKANIRTLKKVKND